MSPVEFHFDFGSPNAYLAHLVIPEIERRTGAKFAYVPVLLGGVFKLTGNRSPAESLAGIKNKPEYERLETERFLKRHGITRYPVGAGLDPCPPRAAPTWRFGSSATNRSPKIKGVGTAAEEPMVCTTPRWRGMDSNF